MTITFRRETRLRITLTLAAIVSGVLLLNGCTSSSASQWALNAPPVPPVASTTSRADTVNLSVVDDRSIDRPRGGFRPSATP